MTFDVLLHAFAVALGLACVALFFRSIIVTVFLDRPRHDAIVLFATRVTRVAFDAFLSPRATQDRIDRGLLWYWPVAQFVTTYTWYTLVAVGFGLINWGAYASPDIVSAMLASGSALSTVGFLTPPDVMGQAIAVIEGGIGLFIVVFLLTFIPGYLTARQVRADRVAGIYARGGTPPTGAAVVAWYYRAGQADRLSALMAEWEVWIRDLGVSHSQSTGLAMSRSHRPTEYWVSAVMAMMDAAALVKDVLGGPAGGPEIFLDAAQQALGHVARSLHASHIAAPAPARAEFEAICDALVAAGAPVQADRDAAWLAFRATQDGYAALLVSLATRTRTGPATWRLTARGAAGAA